MEKIGIKDKKILFYLLQDSRQSFSKIGKLVGQSKELISYRIKRMQEKGIIKKFTTLIDATKFGVVVLSYYYKLDNMNPKIRNEMIKLLADSKYTRYIASTDGKYDLVVWYYYKNYITFNNFYEKVLKNYRKYLAKQILTGDLGAELFSYDFLLSDKKRQSPQMNSKKTDSKYLPIDKFDEHDILILKELSNNPRIKLIEIANKIGVTANIVKYKLKKLIDNKIIFSFSTVVDWNKFGYKYFTIEIFLNDYNQKNRILTHLKNNPFLIKILNSYGHGVDIKCDIIQKDLDYLRNFIGDLTNIFPNSIKNVDYFNTYEINKLDYLPPI